MSREERPKLSFSERDKRRREKKNGQGRGGGGANGTRSEASQRRGRQASAPGLRGGVGGWSLRIFLIIVLGGTLVV